SAPAKDSVPSPGLPVGRNPGQARVKIAFGADHNAATQSASLIAVLRELGDVLDVVALDRSLQDYVAISNRICQLVATGHAIGVLVCGTGIGISIVANKHSGIYAARCISRTDAEDCRRINHANVLCLSAKIDLDENTEIIRHFLRTEVDTTDRRLQRLRTI